MIVCRLIKCSPQLTNDLSVSPDVLSLLVVSAPDVFLVPGLSLGAGVWILMVNIREFGIKKQYGSKMTGLFGRRKAAQKNGVYNFIMTQRLGNLFMLEVVVGNCKLAHPLKRTIFPSLRIGKSVVHSQLGLCIQNGTIPFSTTLRLNIDRTALETQRCSLALICQNPNKQGVVLGAALIALPRNGGEIQKKAKITQCADKTAEIEFTLRITPLDGQEKTQMFNFPSICSITEGQGLKYSEGRMNVTASSQRQVTCSVGVKDPKVAELERQCASLRDMLQKQREKNEQSSTILEKLVSTLEETQVGSQTQIKEPMLLQEVERDERLDEAMRMNEQLVSMVQELWAQVDRLKRQKQELEGKIQSQTSLMLQRSSSMQKQSNIASFKAFKTSEELDDLCSHSELMRESRQYLQTGSQTQIPASDEDKARDLLNDLLKEEGSFQTQIQKVYNELHISQVNLFDLTIGCEPIEALRTLFREINMQKQILLKKAISKPEKPQAKLQSSNLELKVLERVENGVMSLGTGKFSKERLMKTKFDLLRELGDVFADKGQSNNASKRVTTI